MNSSFSVSKADLTTVYANIFLANVLIWFFDGNTQNTVFYNNDGKTATVKLKQLISNYKRLISVLKPTFKL